MQPTISSGSGRRNANSTPPASPVRCTQPNFMATQDDHTKLINLLDKAEKFAGKFKGGYSEQFLSAEEFHQALFDSISKFREGDNTQLGRLYIWFLPTSCWDDFIGKDGQDLANEISSLLLTLTKHNEI